MRKTEAIKQAVLANHGGFADASDSQIMALWHSLDSQTQSRYLAELKQKEKPNAVSDKPESKMRN